WHRADRAPPSIARQKWSAGRNCLRNKHSGHGRLVMGTLAGLFFVSSSLLSSFRAREKAIAASDKFSKGSQRDLSQVVANGGLATLFALCYGFSRSPNTRRRAKSGFIGALATATADTWAT